jgi:hypothetical protein
LVDPPGPVADSCKEVDDSFEEVDDSFHEVADSFREVDDFFSAASAGVVHRSVTKKEVDDYFRQLTFINAKPTLAGIQGRAGLENAPGREGPSRPAVSLPLHRGRLRRPDTTIKTKRERRGEHHVYGIQSPLQP